ncbi:MAG: glycosyl hydrolase 53 family protein [Candidatus Aenigmatarchaeota archaeon]|nr:MAG: glycosyl hydrolase 53 family protein [Candidatus Aenigmarchaeota archaeon]
MKKIMLILLAAIILTSGCVDHSGYDLPIDTRGFYIGVVPNPKSIPETTWDNMVNAYEETGRIAEVTMIWTGENIGQYEKLKQNKVVTAVRVYGLKPVLTLNFATLKEVPGSGLQYVIDAPDGVNADLSDSEFREMWINEARNIAWEFQPEYFSLGNEINDYFYLHPEDLDDYLSLFDEAYSAIKEVSPQTKVFVVFSYSHLIDNNQWDLFDSFNERVDLIGVTTYSWKHFDDPKEIGDDYYTRLGHYTSNKPIAFTEIGWISSESKGSSEEEQARFLVRFLELTKNMDIEMVNWLFLHEAELTGIVGSITEPETGTISLKRANGRWKEVYYVWLDLKEVKYSG